MQHELAAERLRQHLDGEVVARRPEAAGDEHDGGAPGARRNASRMSPGSSHTEVWKRVSISSWSSRSTRNALFESTISPRRISSPMVRISAFIAALRRRGRRAAARARRRARGGARRARRPRDRPASRRPPSEAPLGPPDRPRLPHIKHPERDESGHEQASPAASSAKRQRGSRRSGASVTSCPATSSITIRPSSSRPVAAPTTPAARTPAAKATAQKSTRRAAPRPRSGSENNTKAAHAKAEAAVPGAIGERPTPATLAKAKAKPRGRSFRGAADALRWIGSTLGTEEERWCRRDRGDGRTARPKVHQHRGRRRTFRRSRCANLLEIGAESSFPRSRNRTEGPMRREDRPRRRGALREARR